MKNNSRTPNLNLIQSNRKLPTGSSISLKKGDMSANEIYCRLDNEGVSKRVARMVKNGNGNPLLPEEAEMVLESVQLEEGAINGPQV